MARIKPRGRYMAISVPIALHEEISKHVEKSSYNSIAPFVKDAVREKIQNDKKPTASWKVKDFENFRKTASTFSDTMVRLKTIENYIKRDKEKHKAFDELVKKKNNARM